MDHSATHPYAAPLILLALARQAGRDKALADADAPHPSPGGSHRHLIGAS